MAVQIIMLSFELISRAIFITGSAGAFDSFWSEGCIFSYR